MKTETMKILYESLADLEIIRNIRSKKMRLFNDLVRHENSFNETYGINSDEFETIIEKILCQIQPDKS